VVSTHIVYSAAFDDRDRVPAVPDVFADQGARGLKYSTILRLSEAITKCIVTASLVRARIAWRLGHWRRWGG
jgi:hypothetical protein